MAAALVGRERGRGGDHVQFNGQSHTAQDSSSLLHRAVSVPSRSMSTVPSGLSNVPSSMSSSAPSHKRRASDKLGSYVALDILPEKGDHNLNPLIATPGLEKTIIPTTAKTESRWLWLLLYFLLNLALTLQNKVVLMRFPYPFTMTAVHIFISGGGSLLLQLRSIEPSSTKSRKVLIVLALYSVLYTINIAMSNVSLGLVSVPLHQVIRSLTPFFIVVMSLLLVTIPVTTILSLVPVVLGVGMATFGNYSCTFLGLAFTLFGTFLASLKSVVTNIILGGNLSRNLSFASIQITPSELLFWMSPLAFLQCISYAYGAGELAQIAQNDNWHVPLLLSNGLIAFALNYTSLTANKSFGALTMTVAANIKQVLVILVSIGYFELQVSALNAAGIAMTVLGGGLYALAEHRRRDADSRPPERDDYDEEDDNSDKEP